VKSILLVEDDPFVVDIYTKKLVEAGFSVEVAQDKEEILKKITEKMPDLLLLDIVLPNIEGWDLLKEIKEDLTLKDLKVAILSNLGQKSDVEKGIKLGATRYFIKAHYTPTQVVEEIKKILAP
jgi:DNA-binding response OmpR family regulator